MLEHGRAPQRVVLVRLGLGGAVKPLDLEEFEQLARSAGTEPVAVITGRRERPDPRYFVGSGKAQEIAAAVRAANAELILIDHPLSPSQERNLEQLAGRRVLDRSGLILDIFAQRARSFEGKLEVELAQLKHLSTRLVRGWTHLERQKGGIGLRGPGETQLETDRRLLMARVRSLTQRLRQLKLQRDTGRSARREIPVPAVALVGYTNAGKSTLFHALTGSEVYIADQLFATLDPTVRRVQLPGSAAVVLADTVGFIRELPHELVAAFQSTLQETRDARLLLHVVDASDPRRDEHTAQVDAVLREIGAGAIPQLRVYNKIDRGGLAPRFERDAEGQARTIWVSAQQQLGLPWLREAIAERLGFDVQRRWLRLSPSAGALRARLHAAAAVRDERALSDGSLELLVELPAAQLHRWSGQPGISLLPPPEPLHAALTCEPSEPYLESEAAPNSIVVR